jgi:hypothetical protein
MLCDCGFGRRQRPYHAYSGRLLKPSDLGYSTGQSLPVFIGAYPFVWQPLSTLAAAYEYP